MEFDLSEELIAVRDLAFDFAQREIAPTAGRDDQEHRFRGDLVAKMGQLGFFGCIIPEEYGGTNLGFLVCILCRPQSTQCEPDSRGEAGHSCLPDRRTDI
jgi:glutaryl-CoA dehydrogenase (non-decarboxylating)